MSRRITYMALVFASLLAFAGCASVPTPETVQVPVALKQTRGPLPPDFPDVEIFVPDFKFDNDQNFHDWKDEKLEVNPGTIFVVMTQDDFNKWHTALRDYAAGIRLRDAHIEAVEAWFDQLNDQTGGVNRHGLIVNVDGNDMDVICDLDLLDLHDGDCPE